MRRRLWLPIVTAASLLLPVAAVQAQASSAGAEPSDARAWLARIHAAAQQRNYQGTMVVSAAGGMLSSSRVAHFCVGDQTFERLEALDGRQQRVYRVDDVVHTVWPQQRVVVVEKRTPISRLPSSRAGGGAACAGAVRTAARRHRACRRARCAGLPAASARRSALRPAPVGRQGHRPDAARRCHRPAARGAGVGGVLRGRDRRAAAGRFGDAADEEVRRLPCGAAAAAAHAARRRRLDPGEARARASSSAAA